MAKPGHTSASCLPGVSRLIGSLFLLPNQGLEARQENGCSQS